jgi:hypothetical protein
MPKAIFPILIMLAMTSCQPRTNGLSEAEEAEITAAVRRAATEYAQAWRSQEDIDQYMSYFSDWAGTPWGGYDSLAVLRRQTLTQWGRLDWQDTLEDFDWEVRVLGPSAAAVQGTAHGVVTDTLGTSADWSQHEAHVWIRENGKWKILIARTYVGRSMR